MKKILIILGIVLIIVLGGGFYLLRSLAEGFASGGGSSHIVPDTAKNGEPLTIGLLLNTWGKHSKPISKRYTDISLYYRLVGENEYKLLQSTLVDLPDNLKGFESVTSQYAKYEFTIPAYPKGTIGEIEYYVNLVFDGHSNHAEGIKKIKLIEQPIAKSNNEYLLGEWSLYLDCPNTIFNFKQNNIIELKSCGQDHQSTSNEVGVYEVTEKNIIATFPKSGVYPFMRITKNNEQELQLVRFDKEFTLFKVQK